jgi:hypothetical protein
MSKMRKRKTSISAAATARQEMASAYQNQPLAAGMAASENNINGENINQSIGVKKINGEAEKINQAV